MLHNVWHYVEPGILLAILIVALTSGATERTQHRWFGRLARRRWLAVGIVSGIAFVGAVLLTLGRGAPVPAIHDEFAYLLQGDTFIHGRLTNPPHPLAEFFDTFHVLQKPTYTGKYPPAQGLLLALGQILGHPVVGVWISFALFCGALCWMLQAWLPPRWALLGALLMTVRLLAASGIQQWAYGYWGGAVAALGGALLFGAGRRLWERPQWTHSLALATGLTLLANSRPWEGLLVSMVMLGTLAWRYLSCRVSSFSQTTTQLILPVAAIMTLCLAWMGHYNQRVTGDWHRFPYREHSDQYTQVPLFLWQADATSSKPYSDPLLQEFYCGFETTDWNRAQHWRSTLELTTHRLMAPQQYFLGWLLFPLWIVGCLTGKAWPRFAAFTFLGLWGIGLQTCWFLPHYLAPAICLVPYLVMTGMRRVWHWRIAEREVGRTYVMLTLLAYALLACVTLVPYKNRSDWNHRRAQVVSQLTTAGGEHVVIVRYSADHSPHCEWVANQADINEAPIIWAREKEPEKLRQLLQYYPDRKFWVLEADESPAKLEPLDTSAFFSS